MFPAQRYEQIEHYLHKHGSLSVHELVELLGVSRETIRRDIQKMQEQGILLKVHGGATISRVAEEKAYAQRVSSGSEEKKRIGMEASSRILEGQAVFIDSGTTCLELAKNIAMGFPIQVFTNSLVIAEELSSHKITTYILGGLVRSGELSVSGAMAQSAASSIQLDIAFFGAGGVSAERGIMDYHMEEASLRNSIAERSEKNFVLADSSKFGATALVRVFSWQSIDCWITDTRLDETKAREISKIGTAVVRV